MVRAGERAVDLDSWLRDHGTDRVGGRSYTGCALGSSCEGSDEGPVGDVAVALSLRSQHRVRARARPRLDQDLRQLPLAGPVADVRRFRAHARSDAWRRARRLVAGFGSLFWKFVGNVAHACEQQVPSDLRPAGAL